MDEQRIRWWGSIDMQVIILSGDHPDRNLDRLLT